MLFSANLGSRVSIIHHMITQIFLPRFSVVHRLEELKIFMLEEEELATSAMV
jgi:hypothetical protein